MKLKVKVLEVKKVNELDTYWNADDRIQLLEKFNFPDADKSKPEELKSLLLMAISDFEPNEAAEILLTYKLGDQLNEGQIQSLSHEMSKDKVAEEYPEPALHFDLFNINQLLFKGYNGTFPNTEASIITLEIDQMEEKKAEITSEILIKALTDGLKDNNLIKRLFDEQLNGNEPFTDAEKTIWKINPLEDNQYQLITSTYWVDQEEFIASEYDSEIKFHQEED
jgi:hypothetical protein